MRDPGAFDPGRQTATGCQFPEQGDDLVVEAGVVKGWLLPVSKLMPLMTPHRSKKPEVTTEAFSQPSSCALPRSSTWQAVPHPGSSCRANRGRFRTRGRPSEVRKFTTITAVSHSSTMALLGSASMVLASYTRGPSGSRAYGLRVSFTSRRTGPDRNSQNMRSANVEEPGEHVRQLLVGSVVHNVEHVETSAGG